jgi:F420-dependent oxidoreductase-like protein
LSSSSSSKIKFGIVIPQGWSYSLLLSSIEQQQDEKAKKEHDGDGPVEQYNFSKRIAEAADKSAFDSIYTYDHFLPYYAPSNEKNFFECFSLLSSLAAITKRVKLGQAVTCNSYRNPALLAKMLSTLDVISNGRVEIGIGAGWNQEEYIQYGYNFDSGLIRIRQLDESLSVIKAMWTQDRANFSGKFYSIKDAICNPKPIQKPHPIVMIGGSGEKYLLKVVARHANRYNHPAGSSEILKRKISVIIEHCNAIGRNYKDIDYSVLISCLIVQTDEEVKEKIKQLRKINPHVMQQVGEAESISTVGTPEKILSALNKYIGVGVTHFILDFIVLDERSLSVFDSKVIKKI